MEFVSFLLSFLWPSWSGGFLRLSAMLLGRLSFASVKQAWWRHATDKALVLRTISKINVPLLGGTIALAQRMAHWDVVNALLGSPGDTE